MIIFSLEALADDSHRRHFIEPPKRFFYVKEDLYQHDETGRELNWQPDFQSYYDACDGDRIISPTMRLLDFIAMNGQPNKIQIWTSRYESDQEKTMKWLKNYSFGFACHEFDLILKMRPIGDNSPAHELKERWLNEHIAHARIDFIFETDPQSIAMFRSHGIFVFDCNQSLSR